jgi:hypothetical protein
MSGGTPMRYVGRRPYIGKHRVGQPLAPTYVVESNLKVSASEAAAICKEIAAAARERQIAREACDDYQRRVREAAKIAAKTISQGILDDNAVYTAPTGSVA